MVTICWSVKGGVGVSVVSAALALSLADTAEDPVVLVDLAGDSEHVLGHHGSVGRPGVGEWLATDLPAAALGGLVEPVTPRVSLLSRGQTVHGAAPGRAGELGAWLAQWPGDVVVDLGTNGDLRGALLAVADRSLLILRLCYLGIRAAVEAPRPDGVIVVEETGRALTSADIASVLDVPVVARLPFDPTISRAVDAGLLASRPPRLLTRALRPVVENPFDRVR